jgi:hypothetical protein
MTLVEVCNVPETRFPDKQYSRYVDLALISRKIGTMGEIMLDAPRLYTLVRTYPLPYPSLYNSYLTMTYTNSYILLCCTSNIRIKNYPQLFGWEVRG